MATIHNISGIIRIALLSWCLSYGQPAVAQIGPERSGFGPDITRIQVEHISELRKAIQTIYASEVGTIEIGKNNHGPGPKKYLKACGLGEGYPYCACFVKYVLDACSVNTQGGTAWSPSWFPASKVIWKPSHLLQERSGEVNSQPTSGDLFGLYYTNLKRIGHVGFIDVWDDPRADGWVFTVEGNTNGEGSREGDGVHRRRRLKSKLYVVSNWIDP